MNKKKEAKITPPALLRGMKDILPSDQDYWFWLGDKVRAMAAAYGFERIDTPIMEGTSLFSRSIGEETDIVSKEMYSFVDQGGDKITLRPEGTAPIARAYIEHGMINQPQPIKLYYWGPFFRHERPQAGRYRQLWQLGFEVLGEADPVIDAEIILLVHSFYQEIGLPVTIQVNSIGCPVCREDYKLVLVDFFRPRRSSLCEDCKKRLVKNPLRILDCKVKECAEIAKEVPQIVDHLCEDCRLHFTQVLEFLDDLEISYSLNPHLVRGLDYYTKTIFEVWTADGEVGSQSALAGGGRYNNLVESLGGRPTPAIGFAAGIERMIIKLKEKNIAAPAADRREIFVAQLGDKARKKCLKLFEELRRDGFKVRENLSKNGLKDQLEVANKLGVKFALIIGQKEIMDDTVLIRDMESGIQEVLDYKRIAQEVRKRLEKSNTNFINHTP
ncbi:MAG: histidine--tRNA ligase [Patescibacteria group bacterium]